MIRFNEAQERGFSMTIIEARLAIEALQQITRFDEEEHVNIYTDPQWDYDIEKTPGISIDDKYLIEQGEMPDGTVLPKTAIPKEVTEPFLQVNPVLKSVIDAALNNKESKKYNLETDYNKSKPITVYDENGNSSDKPPTNTK